ncbi:MAG: hypothetical protein QGH07_13170, partial [Alphaproteobacteria bacterium]|nr:hypothetical protein [Alphaproteobacteria bacterium]
TRITHTGIGPLLFERFLMAFRIPTRCNVSCDLAAAIGLDRGCPMAVFAPLANETTQHVQSYFQE